MKDKEKFSILKMIEYIEKIQKYTSNYIFEEFIMDDKTVEATVFCLSQIGELVKNLSNETTKKYPYRWRTLRGLRNRIVHDYEGIKLVVIWDIITNELEQLKNDLKNIINIEELA